MFSILSLTDKKKNYTGRKHEHNTPHIYKACVMGSKSKKRDATLIEKKFDLLLNDPLLDRMTSMEGLTTIIKKFIDDVYKGKYDDSHYFKSTKYKLPAQYKNPERQISIRCYNMIKAFNPGLVPNISDRVFFTVIKDMGNKKSKHGIIQKGKMIDRIIPKVLFESDNYNTITLDLEHKYKIDLTYFVQQCLKNCSSKLELYYGSAKNIKNLFYSYIAMMQYDINITNQLRM
jgi:hypothetical protein